VSGLYLDYHFWEFYVILPKVPGERLKLSRRAGHCQFVIGVTDDVVREWAVDSARFLKLSANFSITAQRTRNIRCRFGC
jgi:hypothetical protein